MKKEIVLWKKMMNKIRLTSSLICLVVMLFVFAGDLRASDDSDVRATVQQVFQQLKSKDYNSLYDVLPAASRSRITRDRFTSALQRAQNLYALDRMDVGSIKVAGDIAVVDTVLYGRVVVPVETEGKIVVQQYLVKENGKWRVATGDRATINHYLKTNPAFQKSFAIRQPRIYVKQNGKWIEFRPPGSKPRSVA
jgi:hypothetical protein